MAIGPLLTSAAEAVGPHNFVLPARIRQLTAAEQVLAALGEGGALSPQQLAAGRRVAQGKGLIGSGRVASLTNAPKAGASAAQEIAAGRGIIGSGRVAGMVGEAAPAVSAAQRVAAGEGLIGSGRVAQMLGGGASTAARGATSNAAVDALSGALGAGRGATAAEGAAAQAAGRGGLLARMGLGRGAAVGAGEAAGGTGLLASLGGRAALTRASLYAGGGQLAGMGIEKAVGHREGVWDDALRNAAVGAGAGAGLGVLGGPFAPLTSTVGAIGGGILGGIHGALTGRGSDEGEASKAFNTQNDKFQHVFDLYGTSDALRDDFMMQFRLMTDGAGRKDVNAVADQLQAALPQMISQDMAMQREERGRAAMYASAQAWMAPQLEQAFDRQDMYAQQLGQSMENSAGMIRNREQRAFALDEARRVPFDSATMQSYAMQQLMSLPGLYGAQAGTQSQPVPTNINDIMGAQPNAAGMAAMQFSPAMFPGAQQQAPGPVGGQTIPGLQLAQ